MTSTTAGVSFGIMTPRPATLYADLLCVWHEADAIPQTSTNGCSTT